MISTTALPLPTISPEVRAFAAEHGAEQYLPNVVSLVRRLFPQAAMHVHVEGDPELSYNWQIVFEVSADGLQGEEQFQLNPVRSALFPRNDWPVLQDRRV